MRLKRFKTGLFVIALSLLGAAGVFFTFDTEGGACAAQTPGVSTAATETTANPAGQLPTVAGFEPQADWQPVTG